MSVLYKQVTQKWESTSAGCISDVTWLTKQEKKHTISGERVDIQSKMVCGGQKFNLS